MPSVAASSPPRRQPSESIPELEVASRADFRSWLAAHGARTTSRWLVVYKKGSPRRNLSYDDVVEECLCAGWIDGQIRKRDASSYVLLIAPRKANSGWSGVNKVRLKRLIDSGLMRAPGLAAIERAKKDGSWTKLDGASRLEVPTDLVRRLARSPKARQAFERFPPSTRRAILEWISSAKATETRARRVQETVVYAALGLRASFAIDRRRYAAEHVDASRRPLAQARRSP